MNPQPKVSVIIPVYNTEKYLRQCLDSVVNQTLRDIEIICVDDGSTDGSLAILREYEARDKRVRVLTQKNQFAGVARNNGMAAARGEYLLFLDSDDWFDLTMLEKLYHTAQRYGADVTLCGAQRYDQPKNEITPMPYVLSKSRFPKTQPFSARDIPQSIFQITSPVPWTKLFSAEFVRSEGLCFQPLRNSNDVFFVMTALAVAKRIAYVDKVLVTYRVGSGENLQARKTKAPTAWVEAYGGVKEELERRGLYDMLHESFSALAESGCRYNFRTIREQDLPTEKRKEIIDFFGLSEIGKDLLSILPPPPVFEKLSPRYGALGEIPKVSVIIPVYNVEKYLRECLDSVVNQTLRDIEIICVNDGSPDHSLAIMEEYAERDDRFTLISQPNGGQSSARNHGLQFAHGEYLYFIDSDDYLEPNAMKTLIDECEEKALDILFFDYDSFYDGCPPFRERSRHGYDGVCRGVELLRAMKARKEYTCVAWAALFRSRVLQEHSLTYYDGIIHEDELFTFLALLYSERVSHTNKKLYHHRVHDASTMTLPKSAKNVVGYFTCMREMIVYGLGCGENTPERTEASRAADVMHWDAKNIYDKLPSAEKKKIFFDDPLSQLLFQKMIAAPASSIVSANATKNSSSAAREVEALRASWSYRIGHAIVWLPGKIKRGIQCCREHGLRYTIRYGFGKVGRKLRGGIRCCREHGFLYTLYRILVHLHLANEHSPNAPVSKTLLAGQTAPVSAQKPVPVRRDYAYYSQLPPEKYAEELKLWYKRAAGEELDLENPRTFNEKIQWMKLYDSTPLKTRLADKYLVRDWVKEKIGEEYLIPLLGVWDSFDEIDFDKLPNQFALKANHGSGWNIIVKDKAQFNKAEAKEKFDKWMHTNFAFRAGLELHYMNIPPKIIAEQYMENIDQLYDYKVMCFDGKAAFIWLDTDRYTDHHRTGFDLKWNKLPVTLGPYETIEDFPKPKNLEKMISLAEELSKGFAHVRVDFYEVDNKLYFGEMTFTSCTGSERYSPRSFEREVGDLLTLPPKSPIPERMF